MMTSLAGDTLFRAYKEACHGKDWCLECTWWDRLVARFGIDIFM